MEEEEQQGGEGHKLLKVRSVAAQLLTLRALQLAGTEGHDLKSSTAWGRSRSLEARPAHACVAGGSGGVT